MILWWCPSSKTHRNVYSDLHSDGNNNDVDDMNEELLGLNALGHRHCEDCELLIFLLGQYVLGQWCAELLILFLTECFVQGVIHRPDETILIAVNEQWWVCYWLVDTS